ncbi:FRG domain-containing protein [Methanimicrococcus blatticola]|uniref:FRG domain-containing protein n=1 Tax=Methanimicrococcus blatticola TaxID=91560 RepID=A0A484F5G1_9EURY|nr:FRG domain-containing protein [Methanimicrococcus blatticola]MBZ3934931.1 FRG domain-containing protein [Methanimicrococcus blatticola]MCC2508970.1 FRG domain-containing protein [Methanimicrococcus blatticola]TDQ70999.1 FRG domain-containing protein [Methanimicrococcus blatticola]
MNIDVDEKKFEVNNLKEYLDAVSKFQEKKNWQGSNVEFFFRGQANSKWAIAPSIFREDNLSIEYRMIREAIQRTPSLSKTDFMDLDNLTVLQHYGLSTRILDLTLNPLIALYFACQPSESIEKIDSNRILNAPPEDDSIYYAKVKKDNGVVYGAWDRGVYYNAPEVNFVVNLCELGLDELVPEKILKIFDKHFGYFKESGMEVNERYYQMFSFLQNSKFILSSYNNERLVSQSGAFLFPGFEVEVDNSNYSKSRISPGIRDLRIDFQEMFIIPFDKKESILKELDRLNINEASVFPELEHKLKYIKYKNQSLKDDVSFYPMFHHCVIKDFSHYSGYRCPKNINLASGMTGVSGKMISLVSTPDEKFNAKMDFPSRNEKIEKHMNYIILNEIALVSNRNYYSKVIKELFINKEENWYEDTTEIIKLKKQIEEILISCGYALEIRQQKAENIILNIITSFKTVPLD